MLICSPFGLCLCCLLSLEYCFSFIFPDENLLIYALVEIPSAYWRESTFLSVLWTQIIQVTCVCLDFELFKQANMMLY